MTPITTNRGGPPRALWSGCLSAYARVCAITLVFVVSAAIVVRADAVSGNVYGPDRALVKNTTFRVLRADGSVVTKFATDPSGYFSVYLQPGKYIVRLQDSDSVEGDLASYPQPVRQDIRLRKR